MSWNAVGGAAIGAQRGLAQYIAQQQFDQEQGLKSRALDIDSQQLAAQIAQQERAARNDEERTSLLRDQQSREQGQVDRKNALDVLGGLTGPVQDEGIAKLARQFAPHLVEDRIPTGASPTSIMGGKAQMQAPTQGGTMVNPYISEGMKSTMMSIDQRSMASENRLAGQEAALGVRKELAEQDYQYKMQALGQRSELIQAQIARATSAAEAQMLNAELKKSQMQMEMLDRQIGAQRWATEQATKEIDPTKDYTLMGQDVAGLRRQRADELVKGPMGGAPKPNWTMAPTRTGQPTQAPTLTRTQGATKQLKDGGVAQQQPDGSWVRVQ